MQGSESQKSTEAETEQCGFTSRNIMQVKEPANLIWNHLCAVKNCKYPNPLAPAPASLVYRAEGMSRLGEMILPKYLKKVYLILHSEKRI